ncbi:hypothetical protein [Sphingomonas mucosissima]|uniref:PAS fold protein n=1 Tax=Sphingomonas mucosissima TaxID=370959 RepID=A0A245ZPX3_9SPHN|nr:hypothetical protein SPMU_01130 [Sphingomonas mucosissima]
MDTRGFDGARADRGSDPTEGGIGEATKVIGSDERRMHVRAYNHWVSLLRGRSYPAIEDLKSAAPTDFQAHGVLLDFTGGMDDPAISAIGEALCEECGVDQQISRISQVPARSLLSRLTDQYLQIIANRAPIGFEAEFVGTRGHNTLYRGILMPFSSNGDVIDHVYGVINWKEIVGPAEQAQLDAELAAAVRSQPRVEAAPSVWADGPSASRDDDGGAGIARRAPIATLALDVPASAGQRVVLLAEGRGDGMFDIIGALPDEHEMAARAAAALS